MREANRTLINPLGLHARAAAKLVDVANKFASQQTLTFKTKTVDCKSIMSLLLLGAPVGSDVTIKAEGEDEIAAIAAIVELIDLGFHELEDS
ncbi:MAG TPA: HPr family phosphocarrier protein [Gammaproteobacteria bacterium]|nr:HPr family phosphocarrier protein [Gammaproteobacteria bacterium]|tara:strand:+ start:7337 stop:7612 length:276 start_codon:yes stop_codon:yes gene_type:complete